MSSGKDRNKHDGRFDDTGKAGAGRSFEPPQGDTGPYTPEGESESKARTSRELDETFDAGPRPSPEDESQNR